MFAIFPNLENFDQWHTAIKDKLNYPIYGVNADSGEIDLVNLITEYTAPKLNKNDARVIAWVGDEIEGLELIEPEDYPDWFISNLPWIEANG